LALKLEAQLDKERFHSFEIVDNYEDVVHPFNCHFREFLGNVSVQQPLFFMVRLQLGSRVRELALFNLAVDSKLRSCDLVKLRARDLMHGERVAARTIVMQQMTQRPVQFEFTEQTRDALAIWVRWTPTGQELRLPRSIQGGAEWRICVYYS
jgi:hypothetical protein